MDEKQNTEILAAMQAPAAKIALEVTGFAEAMRDRDIRLALHNYVGFEGEPVVLVVAREDRAAEVEAFVEELMRGEWKADSAERPTPA